MIKLICVLGPTASGKTKYAVKLAKEIGAEIISADWTLAPVKTSQIIQLTENKSLITLLTLSMPGRNITFSDIKETLLQPIKISHPGAKR